MITIVAECGRAEDEQTWRPTCKSWGPKRLRPIRPSARCVKRRRRFRCRCAKAGCWYSPKLSVVPQQSRRFMKTSSKLRTGWIPTAKRVKKLEHPLGLLILILIFILDSGMANPRKQQILSWKACKTWQGSRLIKKCEYGIIFLLHIMKQ